MLHGITFTYQDASLFAAVVYRVTVTKPFFKLSALNRENMVLHFSPHPRSVAGPGHKQASAVRRANDKMVRYD